MEEYGIIPAVNPSNLTAKSLLNLCIQQDQSESSKPDAYSFYFALFIIVISLSLRLLLNFRGIIIQVESPFCITVARSENAIFLLQNFKPLEFCKLNSIYCISNHLAFVRFNTPY